MAKQWQNRALAALDVVSCAVECVAAVLRKRAKKGASTRKPRAASVAKIRRRRARAR